MGLKQVAAIEAEMDGLFRQLGRTSGSVNDRIERLQADQQYPNPGSEASRERILGDIEGILRNAEGARRELRDPGEQDERDCANKNRCPRGAAEAA
jgi:uncharacterized protein (DUF885 family)